MNPERRLIGCILLDAPACLPTLRGVLQPHHFSNQGYRRLWLTACKLADDGWPVDYRTVVERLAEKQDVSDLARAIHGELPSGHDWRYYAYLLVAKYERLLLGIQDNGELPGILNAKIEAMQKSLVRLRIASRALQKVAKVTA